MTADAAMNVMGLAGVVAGIVSVILAGFAIWLALYLYDRTKETEGRVDRALASIQAQTDALQKLTGRMMNRLTDAVTAPRAADEAIVLLLSTIREMPTAIGSNLRAPSDNASEQVLRNEIISAYLATYYYAGLTNIALQQHLPALDDVEDDNLAKRIVNSSQFDFNLLDGILAQMDAGIVQANRLHHLYVDAQNLKPFVKDSTSVYRDREAGS